MSGRLSNEEILKALPAPPEGAVFSLQKVERINFDPHPYVIGPKHVGHAADHFCGMLTEDAIRDCESHGGHCYYKEGRYGSSYCDVPYDRHTSEKALFIKVPQKLEKSLQEVPGLHEYLLAIKEQAEALGISGFAFPWR